MTNQFEHKTSVELGGLMAVLSEHLYSTPNVAIRELVQNAHDSIERRLLIDPDAYVRDEPLIHVTSSAEDRTLTFSDNGSGLTRDEVQEFLATIGRSKTGDLREDGNEGLIGMFGLGFLSAFRIAKRVTVTTTSHTEPAQTWVYTSDDAFTYSLNPEMQAAPVGTVVRIELADEHESLAEPSALGNIVANYCCLLPHSIQVDESPRINVVPPWRKLGSERSEYLAFAEIQAEWLRPMTAVPLASNAPRFDGVVWVHGGSSYGNSDNRQMSVYLRGMLVDHNDRDLLPRWAGFMGGTIELVDLSPTASRETLQRDSDYAELQLAISDRIVSALLDLANDEPAVWREVVRRHGTSLIQAAIVDDRLFDLLADHVRVPTSHGDLTVSELAVGRRIHVGSSSESSAVDIMFVAQGIPLARGHLIGVAPFLNRYAHERSMVIVDVGSTEGTSLLFEHTEISPRSQQWIQDVIGAEDEAVVVARFEPSTLPIVVVPNPEAELRDRVEQAQRASSTENAAFALARLHTDKFAAEPIRRVYLNSANGAIEHLLAVHEDRPAAATQVAMILRMYKALMLASDLDRSGQAELELTLDQSTAVLNGLLLGAQG